MSSVKTTPLTAIHLTILKLLREHPEGLDIGQIRTLGKIDGHQHLDKRVRELYPFHEISTSRNGRRFIYQFVKDRKAIDYDYSLISKTLRAKIIHRDGRRCRMCGKTVDDDKIKLHVDQKNSAGLGRCDARGKSMDSLQRL